MTILRNRVQCNNCKAILESVVRHDWLTCPCFTNTEGNTGIYIDGGREYLRRGGNLKNIIDLSEVDGEYDSEYTKG